MQINSPITGAYGIAMPFENENVHQLGTNFRYGQWHVGVSTHGTRTASLTKGIQNFWFIPNDSAIKQIPLNQTVRLVFTVAYRVSDGYFAPFAHQYIIEITRDPFVANLNFVSGDSNSLTIDEGDEVEFVVSLTPAPDEDTNIEFLASDVIRGAEFVGQFSQNPVVVGSSGSTNVTLSTQIAKSHLINGQINVTIAETPGITYSGAGIQINVENYINPTISTYLSDNRERIEEGDNINLTLRAIPVPTKDLVVSLNITELDESGGFLLENQLDSVTIGTSGIQEVSIPTRVVKSHEIDGKINISLESSPYYNVSPHSNLVSVDVTNRLTPTISIESSITTIVEGEEFSFQIFANPTPEIPILVNFGVSESDANSGYVHGISIENPVEIPISGTVDAIIDTNVLVPSIGIGVITVNINADERYDISPQADEIVVSITKNSNAQVPEVSISPVGEDANVVEGENFEFDLVANPAPTKPLSVSIEIEETGTTTGYLENTPITIEYIIDTSGSARISIATIKKLANELDGEFTISIIDQPAFTMLPNSGELVVSVEDQLTPVISIELVESENVVTEGTNYSFTLHASPLPESSIFVDLDIDGGDSGHFGGISLDNPIEISSSGQAMVEVSVNNNSDEIENGQIDFWINPSVDDSYSIHPTLGRISTLIRDAVIPTVSIYSDFDNEEIIEGDGFTFRIEAVPAPIDGLDVALIIQDSGAGHFTGLPGGNTVSIGSSGVLDIIVDQTTATSAYQDGQFSIALSPSSDSNYLRSEVHNSISISVLDQTPVVSITSVQNRGSIVEGGSFTLTVEAYPIQESSNSNNVIVLLTHSDPSGHFIGFSSGNYLIVRKNPGELRGTTQVTVNTRTLSTQSSGTISIGIGLGNTYEISPNANAVSVDVKDQTAPVVSVVSPENGGSITEGDSFTFTVASNVIPQTPFDVEFIVTKSDTGHLGTLTIDDPTTTPLLINQVTIGTTGSRVITVSTNNVSSEIEHGYITISLVNQLDSIYAISSGEREITVGVKDLVKPVVSISSTYDEGVISEGNDFVFTLTAIPAPQSPIFVQVSAGDLGTNHFAGFSTENPVEIGENGITEVTVYTNSDVGNLQHGEINISIDEVTSEAEYLVSPLLSEQSIHVIVKDQVIPVVSISLQYNIDVVTEGESFNFVLQAIPVPLTPISVNVDIDDRGLNHFANTSVENPIIIDSTGFTEVSVSTNNVSDIFKHGRIDLVVTSGDPMSYVPSLLNSSASVGIKDSEKPVVSISSPENGMILVEGSDYSITFTASPRPFSPISVDISGADLGTGHFLAFTDENIVEIGLDGTTTILATTTNNTDSKSNGEINVSVNDVGENAEYMVAQSGTESSIQIQIADFILPEVSIISDLSGQSVIEGEDINFAIESDIVPLVPIQVSLRVDGMGSGHYVDISPSDSFTMLNTNTETATISTRVVTGFAHGEISVHLNDPIESQFIVDDSANSIVVGIRDNDLPVVSLSTTFADEVITEGDSFTFTLTAIPAPFAPIMVDITAVDTGTNHLIGLTESSQIEIGPNGTKQITVQTQNDSENIQNGEITIAIDEVTNSYYQSTSLTTDREFRVIVKDIEIPVVTISASKNNQSIVEGGSFIFRLESLPAPINPIMVELELTESSPGYLNRISASNPVLISSDGYADVTVYTNQITERELGQIDIAIVSSDSELFEISPTDNAISVRIKDQIKSVISIASNQNNGVITEGEDITFTLTAMPLPLTPIFVDLTATDMGTSHLGQLSNQNPIEIGTDGVASITASTNLDLANLEHGTINISIDEISNPDYEVTSNISDKSIQFTVKDHVPPVVSISSTVNGQNITEGESFEFTLEAFPLPLTPISVNFTAEDRGSNHFSTLTETSPITIDESGKKTVTVQTQNDLNAIALGWVDVTVTSGDSDQYSVDSSNYSISVRILDAELPVVSISSPVNNLAITEGDSFEVTLTANPLPLMPIMVNFIANDDGTGHFREFSELSPIEVGTNGVKTITIHTNAIEDRIEHGVINFLVNLASDSSYTVAFPETPPSVRVFVRDLVTPVISITSNVDGGFINEEEEISYQLEAVPAPVLPISVYLGIISAPVGQIDQDSISNPVVIDTTGIFNGSIRTNYLAGTPKHGNVEISIIDFGGADYTVSSTEQSINVQIRDRVKPSLSILSEIPNGSIFEGENINFVTSS